jgi:hypothetical protein
MEMPKKTKLSFIFFKKKNEEKNEINGKFEIL